MPRTTPNLRPSWVAAVALLAAAAGDPARPLQAATAAPDLRLEWRGATAASETLRGREGEVVSLAYLLRNVGNGDAFAAVLDTHTALGRVGGPVRVQPGPASGAALQRALHLQLARGMAEVCVEVWVQTVEASEAGDPHPGDNRICRRLEIQAADSEGASSLVAHALPEHAT